MLTVALNGHPLPATAIVRRGRVMLPMRMTFAALGAQVRYEPRGRVIVAKTAAHTVRLGIGASTARIDGKTVALDVPAQIVAATAFVPLRFAAQALGAAVGYDGRERLVTIATPAFRAAADRPHVTAQIPAPGAKVDTEYPNVSASLPGAGASRDRVSLEIDGNDVTDLASFDGNTIVYLPRTALSPGMHSVAFAGTTVDGQPFTSQWSFETAGTPPADRSVPGAEYGYQFFTNGPAWFRYGDWMHFTLLAPPGGSAYLQLCGLGYQYALWNQGNGNTYIADVPAPYGYWLSSCDVQAYYTAWNGQQYLIPLPLIVGIYTMPQPPYGYGSIAGPPVPQPLGSPRYAPLPPDRRALPVTETAPGAKPAVVKPIAVKPVPLPRVQVIPIHIQAPPVHPAPPPAPHPAPPPPVKPVKPSPPAE